MEKSLVDLCEQVCRARSGYIGSYEQIVRRFQASAFSQAFSIIVDSYLAEDAAQDAFIEAFQKIDSLQKPEAFTSWFRKIVFTACNRIKRQHIAGTTSLKDADNIADPRCRCSSNR